MHRQFGPQAGAGRFPATPREKRASGLKARKKCGTLPRLQRPGQEAWRTKCICLLAPFNYPNVRVELGRPGTGVEFNPDGAELDIYPYGSITNRGGRAYRGCDCIGSGCGSPAWLVLEPNPLFWKYPRTAVRMRRDNLWVCTYEATRGSRASQKTGTMQA